MMLLRNCFSMLRFSCLFDADGENLPRSRPIAVHPCHFLLLPLLLLLSAPLLASEEVARGESRGHRFVVELLGELPGVPWGVALLPDGSALVTLRSGSLIRFDLMSGEQLKVEGLPPIHAEGQGGLLDIQLDPRYPEHDWIWFSYVKPVDGEGATTLARARLDSGRLVDWQDRLVTRSRTSTGVHFGSRITFDESGHLYLSIGDRGVRENGQRLDNHAGTILRLDLNGRAAAGNPYLGREDALPEIWSHGHRNPQGLAWDRVRRQLWELEHGPRGGDELNLIRPGANYGWPVISYGKEYWGPVAVGEGTHREGMEQPVHYYIPSIAPCDLLVYHGSAFPRWRGDLFAGALKLRHLQHLSLDTDGAKVVERRLLEGLKERIRSVTESDDGLLYLTTDSGQLLRIRPLGGSE